MDTARLGYQVLSRAPANLKFRAANPRFAVPPAALLFDAHNHVLAEKYMQTGEEAAGYIALLINGHVPGSPDGRAILDWGCGPARVVRHMKTFLEPQDVVYGTDFNPRTVAWCARKIPSVRFLRNDLSPPLEAAAETFDCVYGMSVLTHLSEEMHYQWRDELMRVLKPEGVLILTTRARHHAERDLTPAELQEYERGACVVQAGVAEGRKWFAAFQSEKFMRQNLFADHAIVDYISNPGLTEFTQDFWVIRKS